MSTVGWRLWSITDQMTVPFASRPLIAAEQETLRINIIALREEHAKRGFATRMVWTRRPDVVRAVWLEGGNHILLNFCKPGARPSVFVRLNWDGRLSLVGNIQTPAGFQCALGNQDLVCRGGNFPAGRNAVFQVELLGAPPECGTGYSATVRARVEPPKGEQDEKNNEASTDI